MDSVCQDGIGVFRSKAYYWITSSLWAWLQTLTRTPDVPQNKISNCPLPDSLACSASECPPTSTTLNTSRRSYTRPGRALVIVAASMLSSWSSRAIVRNGAHVNGTGSSFAIKMTPHCGGFTQCPEMVSLCG